MIQGKVDSNNLLPGVISAYSIDAKSGFYNVMYAGDANHLKEFHVQINDNQGDGFASDWPEWAYIVAKEAILHNKKLWVIYKDVPFGFNLLQVLILNN